MMGNRIARFAIRAGLVLTALFVLPFVFLAGSIAFTALGWTRCVVAATMGRPIKWG